MDFRIGGIRGVIWAEQGVVEGLHLVDSFDEEQGGMEVAFDYSDTLSGIRPHHMRVFVFCLP